MAGSPQVEPRDASHESLIVRERRQLMQALQEGRHISVGSVILRITARIVRTISGGRISLSFFWAVLLVAITPLLVGSLVGLLSPGLPGLTEALPLLIWAKLTGTAMLLAARFYGRAVIHTLVSDVIRNLDNVKHIHDLDLWLTKTYSRRRQFRFCLYFSLVMTTVTVLYAARFGRYEFLGLGPVLIFLVVWFEGGLAWYFTWPGIVLPSRLARYEFVAQVDQPAGSTLVGRLEHLLQRCLIVAAVLASVLTGGISFFSEAASASQVALLIIAVWVPMLSVFAFYHFWIRHLVSRLNGSLLGRIQDEVRRLYESDPELSQETTARVRELDEAAARVRIDKSLTTAGMFETVMGLAQTLALPVLPPLFVPFLKYLIGGGS